MINSSILKTKDFLFYFLPPWGGYSVPTPGNHPELVNTSIGWGKKWCSRDDKRGSEVEF